VPIGIAVTLPAQAVAGRVDTLVLLAMVVGTVVVWWFAGWFWRIGVRNYTGASA
jgi:ABC-2 type transport system permease protein